MRRIVVGVLLIGFCATSAAPMAEAGGLLRALADIRREKEPLSEKIRHNKAMNPREPLLKRKDDQGDCCH